MYYKTYCSIRAELVSLKYNVVYYNVVCVCVCVCVVPGEIVYVDNKVRLQTHVTKNDKLSLLFYPTRCTPELLLSLKAK